MPYVFKCKYYSIPSLGDLRFSFGGGRVEVTNQEKSTCRRSLYKLKWNQNFSLPPGKTFEMFLKKKIC